MAVCDQTTRKTMSEIIAETMTKSSDNGDDDVVDSMGDIKWLIAAWGTKPDRTRQQKQTAIVGGAYTGCLSTSRNLPDKHIRFIPVPTKITHGHVGSGRAIGADTSTYSFRPLGKRSRVNQNKHL